MSFRAGLRSAITMPLRAKITMKGFPSLGSVNAYSTVGPETTSEVVFSSDKAKRTISLNRPKKLNSLNLNMVELILPRLREWEKSESAKLIVLKGEGEKALCAGGDVAALAQGIADKGAEGSDAATHYFKEEFTLDHYMATYPKPIVALQDGITMGGGVGLSVHCPFRVATEKTMFAMPETNIGYFPDVGGTFFLSRLDGQLGLYLGLTSERLKGFDAMYAGVATHYVPSHRIPDLEARLSELHNNVSDAKVSLHDLINGAINDFAEDFPAGYKFSLGGEKREIIDSCFSHNTVEEILAALSAHPSEFAKQTLDTITKRSPTSLKVTLAAIRGAKSVDIKGALTREYHIAEHFMHSPDFVEGVSALLLTKPSRKPEWKPATLNEVADSTVASFFSKLGGSNAPEIEFITDKTYSEYPYKYGLPSEKEVEDFIIGNGTSREFKVTRDETLKHFGDKYPESLGVSVKVNEILDRMTTADKSDSTLLDWKY